MQQHCRAVVLVAIPPTARIKSRVWGWTILGAARCAAMCRHAACHTVAQFEVPPLPCTHGLPAAHQYEGHEAVQQAHLQGRGRGRRAHSCTAAPEWRPADSAPGSPARVRIAAPPPLHTLAAAPRQPPTAGLTGCTRTAGPAWPAPPCSAGTPCHPCGGREGIFYACRNQRRGSSSGCLTMPPVPRPPAPGPDMQDPHSRRGRGGLQVGLDLLVLRLHGRAGGASVRVGSGQQLAIGLEAQQAHAQPAAAVAARS